MNKCVYKWRERIICVCSSTLFEKCRKGHQIQSESMPNYPILEAFSSFCVSVRDKVAPCGLCRWAGAVTPARTYMWNTKSATTYRSSPKIFRHACSILSHLVALFISAAVLAKSVMSCPGRRHPSKSAGYQNLKNDSSKCSILLLYKLFTKCACVCVWLCLIDM